MMTELRLWVMYPKSPSWEVVELGFGLRPFRPMFIITIILNLNTAKCAI